MTVVSGVMTNETLLPDITVAGIPYVQLVHEPGHSAAQYATPLTPAKLLGSPTVIDGPFAKVAVCVRSS